MTTRKFLFPALFIAVAATAPAREITLAECPPQVRAAINARLDGGFIDDIDVIRVDGKTRYVVDIDGPGARDLTLRINATGKVLLTSEDIRFSDCPAPVRRTVNNLLEAGWRVDDVDVETGGKDTRYRVEIDRRNDNDLEVLLDTSGKILKRKVLPDNAP